MATTVKHRLRISRIIQVYPSIIERVYCRIRFLILGQHFLNAVGQYLPEKGHVLDLGCGFGLFGLYFSACYPDCKIYGYELNERRVKTARNAAETLGHSNAKFIHGDAETLSLNRQFDAAYTLDLIHHLPVDVVPELIAKVYSNLAQGGRFIIKDVDHSPAYKRWFTLITDRIMVGFSEPIYYWPNSELKSILEDVGFTVYVHQMRDVLPYPHILYICEK